MDSQLTKTQARSQNFTSNQQNIELNNENISDSSFSQKNIAILNHNHPQSLNDTFISKNQFFQQNKQQKKDKSQKITLQNSSLTFDSQNKRINEMQKSFNKIKFNSSEKILNISFNSVFMTFLGSDLHSFSTFEIRNIMKVQRKLDEHLIYMKNMRNKVRGLSYKEIKRKLWSSSQANLSVEVFKQILFIVPDFYEVKYSHLVDCELPYLIRLPLNHDSTEQRSFQFKKLVYLYIAKTKINSKLEQSNQNDIKIPLISNDFFKEKETRQSFKINEQLNEKKVDFFGKRKEVPDGFSPFSILDNSSDFKETLYFLIRQKDIKLKEIEKETVSSMQ